MLNAIKMCNAGFHTLAASPELKISLFHCLNTSQTSLAGARALDPPKIDVVSLRIDLPWTSIFDITRDTTRRWDSMKVGLAAFNPDRICAAGPTESITSLPVTHNALFCSPRPV